MTKQERNRSYSKIRAEKRAAEVLASEPKPCEWCKDPIPVEKLLMRSTLKYCGKRCNDAAAKAAMLGRLGGKKTDADIDAIAEAVWARKASPDMGRQARSPLCDVARWL